MLSPKNFFSFSTWSNIKQMGPEPVFGLLQEYINDPNPSKVNLSVGAYRDKNGNPYILKCVKEATQQYYNLNVNHEYLPISGLPEFVKQALRIGYGDDSIALKNKNICGTQSVSGTGALRIGMKFLDKFYEGNKVVYISNPTWANHLNLSQHAGLTVKYYKYYDYKNKKLDFDGMMNDIEKAPDKSIFLLHACAHNPTGTDLNENQWKELYQVMKKKQHLPFFDMAYQGFASSDPDKDAYSVRMFANNGMDMCLAQSFAKNFGLYGERIGCLSFVTQNENEANAIKSQIQIICRNEYSNPPKFGAYLVGLILSNGTLRKDWKEELKNMCNRIIKMRERFVEEMKKTGNEIDWEFIKGQKGMFGYTGLNKDMVKELKHKYHIYLMGSGRINCAGFNEGNLEYVAKAFNDVTKGAKL